MLAPCCAGVLYPADASAGPQVCCNKQTEKPYMDNGVPKCCAKGELCGVLGVAYGSLRVLRTLTMELVQLINFQTASPNNLEAS